MRWTDRWESAFKYHEDTDMFCQMALLAEVHYLADRFYLKRIHPAQSTNDGMKILHNYTAFREKWDHRQGKNPGETALLRHAKKYHYGMHAPCRDLKVFQMTMQDFIARPRFGQLRWGAELVTSAVKGMLFGRFKA